MVENVISHTDKSVFFTKHHTVLLNESEAIDVWINDDSKVVAALSHLFHDAAEILFDGFGVVGEIACWLTVEYFVFYAQLVEQLRQDNTSH